MSPDTDAPHLQVLHAGETCRSICHAARLRLLVDAADYFAAVRSAIVRARHSVTIVGWDIDSRLELVPGGAGDGYPQPLGDFLAAVAAARPALRVRILAWDFAMLYALEREWLPAFKLGWRSGRRMHFRLDGQHPPGASHHQKLVVVDDRLAFVGGIDLTRSRWDTSAHAPHDPRRRNGTRQPYAPSHDVQVMFDGDAARAVGALAAERWRQAQVVGRHAAAQDIDDLQDTSLADAAAARAQHGSGAQDNASVPNHGGNPSNPSDSNNQDDPSNQDDPNNQDDPSDQALWPPAFAPDIEDVWLGIALTCAPHTCRTGCQQIHALYRAAIGASRKTIYIENQYFTASALADALQARLARPDAPTVAAVLPREQTGWLQSATMGTLRARLYRRLRESDSLGRLQLYAPWIEGLGDAFINVHSKLMIVDDELLVIGSANFNNRSMVLDTECDVALEAAGDARVRRAIAAMRNGLLAEHLGVTRAQVEAAFERFDGDIHRVIASLGGGARTLSTLEPSVSPGLEQWVPESAVVDPERPAVPDEVVRQFVPGRGGRPVTARLLLLGLCALFAVAMTLAWHYTPLAQFVSLTRVGEAARALAATRFGPVLVVGAYALAAIASVPVTVLIVCAGLLFGALAGSLYALAGSLLAALVSYAIGRWAGREAVRRRAGSRLNRLSKRLGRQGLAAVVVLRLLPLAPFVLVNLAAGASHIALRDYLLGTLIGMGPGIVLGTAFAQQLAAAVRHPAPGSVAMLVAIGVALVGFSVALKRFLGGRQ
ncbi:VTT domain-containing protein [Paraburkholderia sp. RG36]|uniref:VTT domain-containing protein n=2 Tax=Paraburkholderia tagetis TaxID=2913261 RepID=A0A9X1RUV9_9BURK|nr:VTT domain-containing protein [Paraburkholderia tagetis]MCG5075379.1 VTT domain-containing protein [Paraburkholderia tagetis]